MSSLGPSLAAARHDITSSHLNVISEPFLFFTSSPPPFFFFSHAGRCIVHYHVMRRGLLGRGYLVWDAWSTLDCKCVFFGAALNWIEDKRHTPLVAALSFRRSPREVGRGAARGDNLYSPASRPFSFFLHSLSKHSGSFILPSFLAISVPVPSPHPARLRHPSIRLLSISVSPVRGHSV